MRSVAFNKNANLNCHPYNFQGDCRDPFLLSTTANNNESPNVVNIEGKRDGVETPPW